MESKVQCDIVKNAIGRAMPVQQITNVTGPWQHENFNAVYIQPSDTALENTNANKYDEISLNQGQSVVCTPDGIEDYRPSITTGDPEALTKIQDIGLVYDNAPSHRNTEHSEMWPFFKDMFSLWFLRISGSLS